MLNSDEFLRCSDHDIFFPRGATCPKCDKKGTSYSIPCTCDSEGHCFLCRIFLESDIKMLDKIESQMKERMSHYHHSMEPTNDEVTICWLLSYIERMTDKHERIFVKYHNLVEKLEQLAKKAEENAETHD